jgi:nucleotide-binding universal stress UspA family protein
MFKTILVPVDGSPPSAKGTAAAIRMAADQNANLIFLNVVDESVVAQYAGNAAFGPAFDVSQFMDSLEKAGAEILAKAQAKARKSGITSRTVLVETMGLRVADVIVRQAKKHKADLIVIGTHGRRGLSRLVIGSDAEGVLRSAPVPVMLVRAPAGTS